MNKTKKLKILTIVGTRPEIIRLSAIIDRFNKSDTIQHTLIHTGQNYDTNLNNIFFSELKIDKPDYYLDAAQNNAIQTIGQILIKIDPIIDKVNPNAILILGDTIVVYPQLQQRKKRFQYFILKQVTDALI